MNENLDLTKILKDVPSGTKLYSPVCGECELVEIDSENTHPIICRTKTDGGDIGCEAFTADGKFFCDYKNGECLLFPSKENRDWSTFKVANQHKHFEPFQKVLRVDKIPMRVPDPWIKVWSCDFYNFYDEGTHTHYFVSGYSAKDDEVIPYTGNEDKLGKTVK